MAESEVYTFDRLQVEIDAWVRWNFPASGEAEQFLGVVEEVGELAAAYQSRILANLDRDGIAASRADDDMRDAIGDICIYLLNYCGFRDIEISAQLRTNGFNASTIEEFQESVRINRKDGPPMPMLKITQWVGILSHAQLKAKQGIRGSEDKHRHTELNAATELFVAIAELCNFLDYFLESILSETWSSVSKRDWIANPSTGAA